MKKKLLLILLLLMCIFQHSAYAGQEAMTDLTLQVTGQAPAVKNDVALAREEAVKNALEKAIMQATAKIILNKFEDEKFQAMKSIMVGKVDRYIKNYRIISENEQHDEYTVNMHVVVALAPFKDDLLQMGVLQDQGEEKSLSVSLSLQGMKKYSDFDRLKVFLQHRPKIVKSVFPCRFEWQQTYCDLVLVGEGQSLVAELEKSGRYSVEVIKKNQKIAAIHLHVKEEIQ